MFHLLFCCPFPCHLIFFIGSISLTVSTKIIFLFGDFKLFSIEEIFFNKNILTNEASILKEYAPFIGNIQAKASGHLPDK